MNKTVATAGALAYVGIFFLVLLALQRLGERNNYYAVSAASGLINAILTRTLCGARTREIVIASVAGSLLLFLLLSMPSTEVSFVCVLLSVGAATIVAFVLGPPTVLAPPLTAAVLAIVVSVGAGLTVMVLFQFSSIAALVGCLAFGIFAGGFVAQFVTPVRCIGACSTGALGVVLICMLADLSFVPHIVALLALIALAGPAGAWLALRMRDGGADPIGA